jgi:hypothetical protein
MTATQSEAKAAPEFSYVLADTGSPAPQLRGLQARRLTQRCAISLAMAAALVPYVYGDAA